ncbi:hypothetical protein D3C84_451310 [compost metagenome]
MMPYNLTLLLVIDRIPSRIGIIQQSLISIPNLQTGIPIPTQNLLFQGHLRQPIFLWGLELKMPKKISQESFIFRHSLGRRPWF